MHWDSKIFTSFLTIERARGGNLAISSCRDVWNLALRTMITLYFCGLFIENISMLRENRDAKCADAWNIIETAIFRKWLTVFENLRVMSYLASIRIHPFSTICICTFGVHCILLNKNDCRPYRRCRLRCKWLILVIFLVDGGVPYAEMHSEWK